MSPAHPIPVYLSLLAPLLTLFFSLTVCASDPLPLPLLLTLFLHCPSFLSFFLSFCLCVFTALSIYLSVIFWSLLSPLSIFYNPSFAPLLSSIPSCISLYFTLFILSPLAYYLSICMSVCLSDFFFAAFSLSYILICVYLMFYLSLFVDHSSSPSQFPLLYILFPPEYGHVPSHFCSAYVLLDRFI